MIKPEDIARLEEKLDMIIDFFHIGQKPFNKKGNGDDYMRG